MSETCTRLDEILAAHRGGGLSDAERDHAAECGACADALLVESLLRTEGMRARAASTPPTVDRVARRLRSRLEQESARRKRLLGLGLRLAGAMLSVLGSIAAGVWGLRFYGAEAGGWLVSALSRLGHGGTEAGIAPPAAPLATAVTLIVAFLSYSLWSTWAEE